MTCTAVPNKYDANGIEFSLEELLLTKAVLQGHQDAMKPLEAMVSDLFVVSKRLTNQSQTNMLVSCAHDILSELFEFFFKAREYNRVVDKWIQRAEQDTNNACIISPKDVHNVYVSFYRWVQVALRRPEDKTLRNGRLVKAKFDDISFIPVVIEKARAKYISSCMDTWHSQPETIDEFRAVLELFLDIEAEVKQLQERYTLVYELWIGKSRAYNEARHKEKL